jgi:uncharacterized protein involved in exopolysaccharide biosynthesis
VSEKNPLLKIFVAAGILWRRKWSIAAGTAVFTAAGVAYSLLAPATYVARAVIYPQDISARSENSVLGGGLSGALNPMVGVGHLNRVEVILKSREMARRVIAKERLVPVLFPDSWDKARPETPGEKAPRVINSAIEVLQGMVSANVDLYKMTLEIQVRAGEPRLAFDIVQAYLKGLNERLKENVIHNAMANRDFLEAQMDRTADPVSREKIQDLIIRETESAMLLNANAFDLLEAPEVPILRDTPKRKRIVMIALVSGFVISCLGVLASLALRTLRAERKASRV